MAKNKDQRTNQHTICQNCGTELAGPHCHECGQRADEPRRVVIGLVQDFLVDTLAIDGKLARSIWLLFSRPGVLARRYLDGRRVHYSPPFRLYLFTSVFFFLTFFWVTDFTKFTPKPTTLDANAISDETLREIEVRNPEAAEELRAFLSESRQSSDSSENTDAGENDQDATEDADGNAGAEINGKSFRDTPWEEVNFNGPAQLEPVIKQIYEAAQRASSDPRLFFAQIRETLPRALLLAPVFYALILLALYFYRRKFFVYDHFVVALYMHAALYAYLLAAMLISRAPAIGSFAFIPIVWGALQPLFIFRQAYNSNWISTILKWLISMTIYVTGLSLIITFGLTYSLYQS